MHIVIVSNKIDGRKPIDFKLYVIHGHNLAEGWFQGWVQTGIETERIMDPLTGFWRTQVS